MKIRDYIRNEVFAGRAAKHGALVIYDPLRRYRDMALSLAGSQCCVIDAGTSIIEAREASMRALRDLTEGKIQQLIVWLPTSKPESDEDRQSDPFSVLGRIGTEFPEEMLTISPRSAGSPNPTMTWKSISFLSRGSLLLTLWMHWIREVPGPS